MKIIKRNGSEATFDSEKIVAAITKANNSEEGTRLSPEQIHDIADYVEYKCNKIGRAVSVEEVQDMVENQIMATGAFDLAKHYVQYRYQRSLIRKSNTTDTRILSLIECNNEEAKQENSNKNPTVNSVQRDYMAGEVSRDLTQRLLLPSDIVEADQKGLIHFHDSDYFAQHMHNCDLVNLEDMLQNGTVISETKIEKPHSFSTACNIATQIIAQVASNQYGGQSISLAHLAPFVQVSREKIRTEVAEEMKILNTQATPEQLNDIVETRLHREITKGVQTIQYQIITLMTTNGQAPFLTVFMYLNEAKNAQEKKDLALIIEETLKQRYQGVKNEAGVWITPAFPKLIYVLEDDNVEEDSEYFYLTQLAAKCTARRLVPDYISEKVMKELKVDQNGNGQCYPSMGCRSFLTPYIDENGKPKYYGRFNQGVVTINLVDVACSSKRDMNKFWQIFDERLDLCYRALMCRHERLKGTPSDVAPILWQHGALARLKKGETIDKLLYGGYSTISLGYAGLYECVKYMTGKSHTDPSATPFAIEVMQHLNDACAKWKEKENVLLFQEGMEAGSVQKLTDAILQVCKGRCAVFSRNADGSYKYVDDAAKQKAKENAEALLKELEAGGDAETLATKYGVSNYYFERTGYVGSFTDSINKAVENMKAGDCSGVLEEKLGYAVIHMKSDHDEELLKNYAYAVASDTVDDQFDKLEEQWLSTIEVDTEKDMEGTVWADYDLSGLAQSLADGGLLNGASSTSSAGSN